MIKEITLHVKCQCSPIQHSLQYNNSTLKSRLAWFERTLVKERNFVNSLNLSDNSDEFLRGCHFILNNLSKKLKL